MYENKLIFSLYMMYSLELYTYMLEKLGPLWMSITAEMMGLTVMVAWKRGYFSWGTQFFTSCRDNVVL